MATAPTGAPDPEDALDRLWASFFQVRADAAAGRLDPGAVRAAYRDLHARAGGTGSTHVPVFRAEIRGEIARLRGDPSAPRGPGGDHPGVG